MARSYCYDASYPEARGHFEPRTGRLKVRSLERWLAAVEIDPAGKLVCEVGFGGGHCLRHLADRGARVFGIEQIRENLEHARRLGMAEVASFEERCRLERPMDLWVFLDSFEHLPDPTEFVAWMTRRSSLEAMVIIVAPEAGSLSERVLGRLWPHRIPDHVFHWSRGGLAELFGRHGFQPWREFRPGKYVSCAMVVSHLAHKFSFLACLRGRAGRFGGLTLFFNVGEMGLVFRRAA